jgi:uncharacterized protein (TIGR02246 family)
MKFSRARPREDGASQRNLREPRCSWPRELQISLREQRWWWMADTRSDNQTLIQFAERYTAAWCSQNAASVAAFFAPDGSLTINDDAPSAGRAAITAAARSFMTAFPDLVVKMDNLTVEGPHVVYHWRLTGTNTGATGKAVRISGYEQWCFTDDGLIAESQGHFDQAAYQKQLESNPLNSLSPIEPL